MAQINVSINGRSFPIACEDGEEERLIDLSRYVDHHVSDLAQKVGQVGDIRLLIMACLTIADEMAEAVARLEEAEDKLAAATGNAAELQDAQSRLTAIAQKLESA